MLARIEPEQRRYVASGACDAFAFEWKGRYLYVGSRTDDRASRGNRASPLCRLRWTGDEDVWRFEIYKFSTEAYDVDGDFLVTSGSPEQCFSTAADFYLWEYDVFRAGASCGLPPDGAGDNGFLGRSALLPLCAWDEVACPDFPPVTRDAQRCSLLTDFDAFLGYVEGRRFELTPRTMGFRRADLKALNAMMSDPLELGQRPLQPGVPRVQLCFAVATCLGLLNVDEAGRRAGGTAAIEPFRGSHPVKRWWLILDALWHRVEWRPLRSAARGDARLYQAGRRWMGEELARRSERLRFDWLLSSQAEVLESFLIPAWHDAGLLEIRLERGTNGRMGTKTSTFVSEVGVTELGRWAFAQLAQSSPAVGEDEGPDERDGRWEGRDLLFILQTCALEAP